MRGGAGEPRDAAAGQHTGTFFCDETLQSSQMYSLWLFGGCVWAALLRKIAT
jgi:hypothetical protein